MSTILEEEYVKKEYRSKTEQVVNWFVEILEASETEGESALLAVGRTTTTCLRKVGRQIRRRKDRGSLFMEQKVQKQPSRSTSTRSRSYSYSHSQPLYLQKVDVAFEVNVS